MPEARKRGNTMVLHYRCHECVSRQVTSIHHMTTQSIVITPLALLPNVYHWVNALYLVNLFWDILSVYSTPSTIAGRA